MREGPTKLPPMPEEWQERFDNAATDLETLVIDIRGLEDVIKQTNKEIVKSEEEFSDFLRTHNDDSAEGKKFVEQETARQARHVARQRFKMADLEESRQALEGIRVKQLALFERMKTHYNEDMKR